VPVTSDPRFTRQTRLAEVGEEGQARLGAVAVRVATNDAGSDAGSDAGAAVLARYLRRAGVLVVAAPASEDAAPPPWLMSLHPAAREVAIGAHAALGVIRAVLDGAPHPRVQPR
jgi:hypothetical protein